MKPTPPGTSASRRRASLILAGSIAALFASRSAQAASTTWNAAPGTADWATDTNWVAGTAPGAFGTFTNQDTATFLTNTNGNGTTTPVVIDPTRNIKSLTFGSGAVFPAAFTIGTASGESLLLSSAGAISFISGSTGSSTTVTVAAPLVLEPLTNTTAGTYTFSNAHGTTTNALVIGGTVTGGTTSAGITLTLTGANTGANEVKGIINDGGATGGVAVSKTSSGTWKLSGANTYTGATTITQGTLSVGATGNLGASSSALIFNGGTLQVTGAALTNISGIGHAVTFNAGTLVGFDINSGANTFTVDQILNQTTGGLTKAGVGTLVLNQANTYSGTTTLSAGVLGLAGTNSSAGATTVTSGTLQLNNTTANNGGLAGGTLTMANATLQSQVANLAISNNVVINGTDIVSGANTLTINGSFTISGSNRTVSNNIAGGNSLTLAGNVYLSELTGTGHTFTLGGGANTLISGAIANFNGGAGTAGGLLISNTGTTTLSGANTYSGGTTIASSSGPGAPLSVATIGNVGGVSSNLGTAGVLTIGSSVNNGKLVYTGVGENTDRVANLGGTTGNAFIDQSGTGPLKFTSNFTATGAGTKTLTLLGSTAGTGEISGAIVDNLTGTNNTAVTKTGTGTWTLSGTNTYTGITSVNGGTLTAINTSALGASILATAVTLGNATLNLLDDGTGNNGTIVYGPGSGYNVSTSNNTTSTINVGDNTANTGNTIQLGALALAGTLTVTNSNGYNLSFSGAGTMAGSRTLTNNMTSGTTTLASLTSLDAGGRTVTFNGISATAITSVGAISQNGANALNVTQSGAGTLILTGANSYSGTTTLSGTGMLVLSGVNSSATGQTTTSSGSGILQLNNATNGGLAGGTFNLNGGAIQSGVANLSLSNNFIQQGTPLFQGSNNITINGTFTNSGANRTLTSSITGGNTLTLAGNVYLSEASGIGRTWTINGSGNTLISGAIANFNGGAGTAGSLTIDNTGTTTLSGTQTYDTLVTNAGTTNVNSAIGTGTSTVNANATTNFSVSQTLAALNIGAGAVVTLGSEPGAAPDFGATSAFGPAAVPELGAAPDFGATSAFGPAAVPEPGSIGLLMVGALGFLGRRRRA